MKSIRTKILASIMACVSISLLIVSAASIILNVNSTRGTLEQTMTEAARITAERISYELQSYRNITAEIGCVPILSSATAGTIERKTLLDQRAKTYGFERGNFLLPNGDSIFDGNNYADREYFTLAMRGQATISDPVVSKITGEISIIIAAPVWRSGVPNSSVVGVVYFVPKETFLNDIVSSISVSENGGAYMLGSTGTTIAHENMENVKNMENTQNDAKTDKKLASLAALEQKMTQGEAGFGQYSYGGTKKFLAFAPISDTAGWSVAINAPTSDFMTQTIIGVVITIILWFVFVILSALLGTSIAKRIATPVKQCAVRLEQLAHGDLKTPVPTVSAQDETGLLATATQSIVDGLSVVIGDVDYCLDEMANGNFNVHSQHPEVYIGDFQSLLQSMRNIINRLSDTLLQIHTASDQVNSGATQVASGAQALSQGATEQASSVEELAATIVEISEQIHGTAQNALQARDKVTAVGHEATNSNDRMHEMLTAMGDISESSTQISKIIKTIEDIAFQTNILALNAAVEAARAGAAGKGFAVVADEVRNLASKSADASKNTAALIQQSLLAVENGKKIADATAQSLGTVVSGVHEVSTTIDKISDASVEQSNSVQQVSSGIDQISSVVQTNSATAEQSAAASEELNSQAAMLRELVGMFTLRAENAESQSPEVTYQQEQPPEPPEARHTPAPASPVAAPANSVFGKRTSDSERY